VLKDRDVGDKLTLSNLRQKLKTDPELQNLSPERERELLQELEVHRSLKKNGIRATNLAITNDVARTMAHLNDEVRWRFSLWSLLSDCASRFLVWESGLVPTDWHSSRGATLLTLLNLSFSNHPEIPSASSWRF
jgi:hypothetical protein